MNERKNGIDILKLIGAFSVMCLHTDYGILHQEVVDNIRLASRWALPFFFIVSGYFLGLKIKNDQFDFQLIQKTVSRLISLLILTSLIYIPMKLINQDLNIRPVSILTGTHFHLWFIGSIILGYLFLWYIFFIKQQKLLPYITVLILCAALLADSYDLFFNLNIDFGFYQFLLSIPFMYIGVYLSKMNIRLISNGMLISIISVGFALQYIESEVFLQLFNYNKYNHQFLIGTILISIAIFLLGIRLNLKETVLSKWGQNHSLFIYLYHPLIYWLVWGVLRKLASESFDYITIFSPLIGFIFTLGIALLLQKYFGSIFSILNGRLKKAD